MIWQLRDAKARLGEVVRAARKHGPQEIAVRGKTTAVLVAKADFDRLVAVKPSFLDFLQRSPLARVDLATRRNRTQPRSVPF